MSIRRGLLLLLVLFEAGHLQAQPILALGSDGLAPGASVGLPVWLMNSTNLTGLQFEFGFDSQAVNGDNLSIVAASSGIFADAALVASNRFRVVLVSTNQHPLPNGQLASLAVTARTNASDGRFLLPLRRLPTNPVVGSTTNGICVTNITLQGGQLLVGDAFGFTATGGRVQFRADDGASYSIQASTNFVTWSDLSTNTGGRGLIMWLDGDVTNLPHRFYRAKMQ